MDALEYASVAIKDNERVLLAAVEQDNARWVTYSQTFEKQRKGGLGRGRTNGGGSAGYASQRLRKTRVVLAAVTQDCRAFQYASDEILQAAARFDEQVEGSRVGNKAFPRQRAGIARPSKKKGEAAHEGRVRAVSTAFHGRFISSRSSHESPESVLEVGCSTA